MLVNIGTAQMHSRSSKKLLGVKIDCKLNFKDHMGSICKKASAKLNALASLRLHNPDIKRLYEYFFLSQFAYSPLAWMFHTDLISRQDQLKVLHYGTKWLDFLGPKIWKLVPAQLKNAESLEAFKSGKI